MSYQAEISRASPTAILMVMDQSTSMNQRLESGQSKAAFLADVLNKTLYTIITNCSKSDGVRDYFHVGVVAYSGEEARNGFHGPLKNGGLHRARRRCARVSMLRSIFCSNGAPCILSPIRRRSCT